MSDVSRVLGMNVARDHEKVAITSDQKGNTDDVYGRLDMKGCNPICTPTMGSKLSLNQPEEKLLKKKDEKLYQSVTDYVMYLGQISR